LYVDARLIHLAQHCADPVQGHTDTNGRDTTPLARHADCCDTIVKAQINQVKSSASQVKESESTRVPKNPKDQLQCSLLRLIQACRLLSRRGVHYLEDGP